MLNSEQIQKVRQTLQTSGWTEVMLPVILNRGKAALQALTLSPEERLRGGGEFKDTDDFLLRAFIRDCEWMVACWQNEIKVFELNRQMEELQSRENGGEPPG
jgi:hypothetical protein